MSVAAGGAVAVPVVVEAAVVFGVIVVADDDDANAELGGAGVDDAETWPCEFLLI